MTQLEEALAKHKTILKELAEVKYDIRCIILVERELIDDFVEVKNMKEGASITSAVGLLSIIMGISMSEALKVFREHIGFIPVKIARPHYEAIKEELDEIFVIE